MNIVLGYHEEYFDNVTGWLTYDNELPVWLKKKKIKREISEAQCVIQVM
jgi:hypothetical protein